MFAIPVDAARSSAADTSLLPKVLGRVRRPDYFGGVITGPSTSKTHSDYRIGDFDAWRGLGRKPAGGH